MINWQANGKMMTPLTQPLITSVNKYDFRWEWQFSRHFRPNYQVCACVCVGVCKGGERGGPCPPWLVKNSLFSDFFRYIAFILVVFNPNYKFCPLLCKKACGRP